MSSLETAARAQLGLGATQAQVTEWFQGQLLAALSDPLFNLPKVFLTYMADYVATSGLNISAGQIIGFNTDAVRVYKKAAGVVPVVNTTTETPIVDELIAPGSMNTLGILRLTVLGDYVNNGASLSNITWRVKFGGTTFASEIVGTGVNGTTVYPMKLVAVIANLDATNTNQSWTERWGMGQATESFQTTTGAIDTTAAQSLQVTIQHSVAQPATTFNSRHYMIEFL